MQRKVVKVLFLAIFMMGAISSLASSSQGKTKKTYHLGADKKGIKQEVVANNYLAKLKKEHGGTLVFNKGIHTIKGKIFVPSNVTIKLNKGAILIKNSKTKYLFILSNRMNIKKKTKRYKGASNVTIVGGKNSVINLGNSKEAIGIAIAHGRKIQIQNICFQGRNGGAYVGISGSRNISIRHCSFSGGSNQLKSGNYFHVRLEVASKGADSFHFPWSKLDATTNQNILIEKSGFYNSYGGVGTVKYGIKKLKKKKISVTLWQKNIVMVGNRFQNIEAMAIKGVAWRDSRINGNIFTRTDAKYTFRSVWLTGTRGIELQWNSFAHSEYSIVFQTAINQGAERKYPAIPSTVSLYNIKLMKNNQVNTLKHYYVVLEKKWLFFFENTKEKNLVLTKMGGTYHEKYKNSIYFDSNTSEYFQFRSYLEQIARCGGGVLTVKAGTYYLSNALYVPSNTQIIFESGVVLKKIPTKHHSVELGVAKAMFVFVSRSEVNKNSAVSGYHGVHDSALIGKGNVIFDGQYIPGVIDVVLGHNRNISIRGITFFRSRGTHYIELNSSYHVVVENCYFKNSMTKESSKFLFKEAINIDTTDLKTNGFNFSWSSHDKTSCQNIVIRKCQFLNVNAGIGSHSYSANGNQQVYHKGILIENNRFYGLDGSGIAGLNWKNAQLLGNSFYKVGVSTSSAYYGISLAGVINISAKNNYFESCACPIFLRKETTSRPSAALYPTTYSVLTLQNWMDLKKNIKKNCDTQNDILLRGFLDKELPEQYVEVGKFLTFEK